MTPDKTPSDAELLALNAGEVHFSESPTKYPEAGHGTQYHAGAPGVLEFARAVLAKWGTPPAVAGEPVACALDQQGFFDKFQAEYFTEHGYVSTGDRTMHDQFKHVRAWAWNSYQQGLAATPQPTQAQAGEAPLHASVVKRIWDECRAQGLDYVAFAWRIQRAATEADHSIKGGQHAE